MSDLLALLRFTARDPVEGARRIVALNLPPQALWTAFLAVIAVFVILATLTWQHLLATVGEDLPPEFAEVLRAGISSPLLSAVLQVVLMVLCVHALNRVGRAFGGTGTFDGALAVAVIMGLFYDAFAALQLLVMLSVPAFLAPIGLAGLIYLLWFAPGLIMGLHGFRARLPVLAMMIVTFLVLNFALAFVSALFLGGTSDV